MPNEAISDPFGLADCESELAELDIDQYRTVYFGNTPFNDAALDWRTYLIIGRRGAGKTALSHYFSFQTTIRNSLVIDVDEPKEYQRVLTQIARRAADTPEVAVPQAAEVWTYLIWCLIFENTKAHSKAIGDACIPCEQGKKQSHTGFLNTAIDWLLARFRDSTERDEEKVLNSLVEADNFKEATAEVLNYANAHPIFVAIDTLEKYDIADAGLINAIVGLVEAAARFNVSYAKRGLHLKVFVSGEIFPYLMEVALQNPLKSVKHPVHMLWRAKDLLRLIAWRYHRFLQKNSLLLPQSRVRIDWDDPKDVLTKAWIPYFGHSLKNKRGTAEHTFSYVLRHTQMRPRQLIVLCNTIAERAARSGTFPVVNNNDLIRGVENGEQQLATEIVNSYSRVYDGVADIVRALTRMPASFLGSELDRRAPESAAHWHKGGYSPSAFSRLVVELGIVGRVVKESRSGYLDAEFEYSQRVSMRVTHRDKCVIHPMFFGMLDIVQPEEAITIMPFIVHQEEAEWLESGGTDDDH
jgi:hypothetical protein